MAAPLLSLRQDTPATSSPISRSWIVLALSMALCTAAFGLYLRTAAQTITWAHGGADGAELSAAAAVLGIAHPPGYPLYTMLAHLFALLPVGEIAFRVGLLSAASAALGVGLAAAVTYQLSANRMELEARSKEPEGLSTQHSALSTYPPSPIPHPPTRSSVLAAAAAGLTLATAPLYWSQATIAEVYALDAAFVLGTIALLAAWRPGRDSLLPPLALLFGLGLGDHLTLLFLAAAASVYVVTTDPHVLQRRAALLIAGAFLVGLSVYVYLPIRAAADPPLNWGQPDTLSRFLDHVTGRMYQGYLGWQSVSQFAARLPVIARLLIQQLTLPGLALAFLGLVTLSARRRAFSRMLLGYILATALFTLLYNAKDGEVYLLPVVLVLVPCLGLGITEVASYPWGRVLGLAALIAIPAWQIGTYFEEMDVSDDHAATSYARETLASAPPGAVLATEEDEQTFALWYTQIVDGLRPDVTVVDVRLRHFDWYRTQVERRHPGATEKVRP